MAAASSSSASSSAIPKLPAGAPRPKKAWDVFAEATRHILQRWDLMRTAVVEEVNTI
jgi:hypothetical protein